jgi:nucleotide-binding universal stress UspA family protein
MTLVVPFDGSKLAETALVRATEFSAVFDEDVIAVTVIPKNDTSYARKKGWIGPEESFDLDAIVRGLSERVRDLCPSADFRHEVVGRYTSHGAIGNTLRQVAREERASMVFIGSENAGHLVTSVSSVGSNVAAEDFYDVVIIRHQQPARIEKLREAALGPAGDSDFYES